MKKSTDLTFALYGTYKSGWYRFKHFFKDTRILFHRIKFLFKHGYNEQVNWETYDYMIQMWEEILTNYRYHRNGTSTIIPLPENTAPIDEWYAENEAAYDEYLDAMLADLRVMAEDPLDAEWGYAEAEARRQEAANDFFQRMAKIFFTLWD